MKAAIAIEKGVPLPPKGLREVVEQMEVDDSLISPLTKGGTEVIVWRLNKTSGKQFVVRRTEEGVRVWRTA